MVAVPSYPVITQEAAKGLGMTDNESHALARYASLPDYIDSKEGSQWNYIPCSGPGKQISEYFCWSHGAQEQGVVNSTLSIDCPLEALYPDDGRYPGPIMKELLINNMPTFTITDNIKNTINGFRAHNAADRVVHFEYFRGATAGMTDQQESDAWIVHHGLKEVWADFVIIKEKVFIDKTMYFTADGQINYNIDKWDETIIPIDNNIPNLGFGGDIESARLMNLAQRVFIKNHRSIGKRGRDFIAQSVSDIQSLINIKAEEHINHFNETHWADWEGPFDYDLINNYTISFFVWTDWEYHTGDTAEVVSKNQDITTPSSLENEYLELKRYYYFTQHPNYPYPELEWDFKDIYYYDDNDTPEKEDDSETGKYIQAVDLVKQWVYTNASFQR